MGARSTAQKRALSTTHATARERTHARTQSTKGNTQQTSKWIPLSPGARPLCMAWSMVRTLACIVVKSAVMTVASHEVTPRA